MSALGASLDASDAGLVADVLDETLTAAPGSRSPLHERLEIIRDSLRGRDAVSPKQPEGRVTGIEVVEDGPDTVVTLITVTGRHSYSLDEVLSLGLGDTLRGLRSAPAVIEMPLECHFTQRPWDADPWLREGDDDGFEAFGVGGAE